MAEHIHFGSLEGHALELATSRQAVAPVVADRPRMPLAPETILHVEKHSAEQRALRERHIAESMGINAPALDRNVRSSLRALGEPQTMFGEDNYSRRMRLREIIAKRQLAGEKLDMSADMRLDDDEEQKETFFTEGSPELQQARHRIAEYSLPKALNRNRHLRAKTFRATWQQLEEEVTYQVETVVKSLVLQGSHQVDLRPLSAAKFSTTGDRLAVSGWSGEVRIWDPKAIKPLSSLQVCQTRVSGLAWSPRDPTILAAAGGDGGVHMLRVGDKLTAEAVLQGHEDRVNQVIFHPVDGLLFSCSHEGTWRMWDIERKSELLVQEGHAMPVQTIALHSDGSLLVSGDTGGVLRVWDLRTGRSILALEGHAKGVLCCDTHPINGYAVASGSDDNSVKIWDLRRRACVETLMGHTRLVSAVRFEPVTGSTLFTAGFDHCVKVWSTTRWTCEKNLLAVNGPIHGMDLQAVENGPDFRVAACGKNRLVSIWKGTLPE
ncbi:MAG: hypothetical protein KVP17_001906 [Porospora cf. gigantea B]|uniref:uncharacterized protein n=2 Tax=Porospora cf. gigantea B TaxID=2853592 RepID=UPI003571B6D5|nr:MAG: hypothetical protein KVP17_001906 [Porospora cf. gigantea B]